MAWAGLRNIFPQLKMVGPSVSWAGQMVFRGMELLRSLEQRPLSAGGTRLALVDMLIIQAGGDTYVDNKRSSDFFTRLAAISTSDIAGSENLSLIGISSLGRLKLVHVPESFHEIFVEEDSVQQVAYVHMHSFLAGITGKNARESATSGASGNAVTITGSGTGDDASPQGQRGFATLDIPESQDPQERLCNTAERPIHMPPYWTVERYDAIALRTPLGEQQEQELEQEQEKDKETKKEQNSSVHEFRVQSGPVPLLGIRSFGLGLSAAADQLVPKSVPCLASMPSSSSA
jgi:hypothetical protein